MTFRWNPLTNRLVASAAALALAIVIALSASAGWMLSSSPAAADDSVTIPLAKAAVLVDATSGDASVQMQAVGEQAKLINAALPFGSGPIAAARPFQVSGDGLDSSRALLCLTQAVYYEAGYEPTSGRRAVAQVILNRLRHPAFPKSLCGVVYQRSASGICQFTFVCDGALSRAPEAGAWRQARDIAEAALDGYVERSVGEATHYHADYVAPRWAPLLTKVSKIGAHIFYRWPGAWGQPAAFNGRYIGEPRDPLALRPPQMVLAVATVSGDRPELAGPPVSRAPNDVGGLLDTTKGWTLNIPDPRQSGSAAARIVAEQQAAKPVAIDKPAAIEIASAGPAVIAGR